LSEVELVEVQLLKTFFDRFVFSFPPTFKDTNKKASVYAMINLGLVKRKIDHRRVRVPDPRQRRQKKGLVDGAKSCSSSPQAYEWLGAFFTKEGPP
jgi:hypothetical protein